MPEPEVELRKAVEIIRDGFYVALATVSPSGNPWCTPLYYAVTSNLEFITLSSTTSIHASNLRGNSEAAWCIYTGALPPEASDGVYFGGSGQEVEPNAAQTYADELYDQRFPDPAERAKHPANPAYWESTGRRLYLLRPNHAWKVNPDDPAGVSRIELDLEELRAADIGRPSAKS